METEGQAPMIRALFASLVCLAAAAAVAADSPPTPAARRTNAPRAGRAARQQAVTLPATQSDVPYGAHERHVLDFWKAESVEPTPLVFVIHGGGWVGGDKDRKLPGFEHFLAERERILPWIAEYSPYALVSADDPPIHLSYGGPPSIGQPQQDPTHSANFGLKLKERCEAVGVHCELAYPGAAGVEHATATDALIAGLLPDSR